MVTLKWCLCIGLLTVIASLVLIFLEGQIADGAWWAIIMAVILVSGIIVLTISTWLQPENQDAINFKVKVAYHIIMSICNYE